MYLLGLSIHSLVADVSVVHSSVTELSVLNRYVSHHHYERDTLLTAPGLSQWTTVDGTIITLKYNVPIPTTEQLKIGKRNRNKNNLLQDAGIWYKGLGWCQYTSTPHRPPIAPCKFPYKPWVGLDTLLPWWRHQMETFSALLARSPVNSPHKVQWRGALMFSLICSWINGWVNNREAGDLRRHSAHYDVIVMSHSKQILTCIAKIGHQDVCFKVYIGAGPLAGITVRAKLCAILFKLSLNIVFFEYLSRWSDNVPNG